MRRILLVVTFMSVAAWSQPAQQQTQVPIVVKVETVPESVWTALFKVAIPTILGAALGSGITLYGLRQTNKHQSTENEANRRHELEKLNREHSFSLKRDVLIRLTQSLVQSITSLRRWDYRRANLEWLESNPETEDYDVKQAVADKSNAWNEYLLRHNELQQATAAACLAVSDELWKSAQAVGEAIAEAHRQTGKRESLRTKTIEQVEGEIATFTKAARRELGIVHIDA